MKKILHIALVIMIFLSVFNSCGIDESFSEPADKATVSDSEYKSAYKEKLNEILESKGSGVFSFVYIDDDDIPELVVAPLTPSHMDRAALYSYDGENVVENGDFGDYGCFDYLPKKGLICWHSLSQSGEYHFYYKLEGNKVSLLSKIGLVPESQDEYELNIYFINDATATEAEYNAELERYTSKGEFITVPDKESSSGEGTYILSQENINSFWEDQI